MAIESTKTGALMRANEKQLLRFLEGTDKQFVIPVYQRNYDWSTKQCKQLFNDLEHIIKDDFRTHFLGSLVHVYNTNSSTIEYIIIDGQQRLTTVSLLLLALHTVIKEGNIDGKGVNAQKIFDEYLIDKYAPENTKIKLKPIKDDFNAYKKLFEQDEVIPASNITTNYHYFYNLLKQTPYKLSDIYTAIEKLVIVEIELKDGEDDAQLIFESLNSTGLDLTEADKVRNFILMKQNRDIQEKYYTVYWSKIEKNTNYDVSSFLRHYLTIKNNRIPNQSDVYMTFKNFYAKYSQDMEALLEELLNYSKIYRGIITNNFGNPTLNGYLLDLNRLETVVSYPFVLELLAMKSDGMISESDSETCLKVIRDYVVRRFICDIPTNSLNKTFMTLNSEIKKHDNYKNSYAEICKYILLKKDTYQRLPDDTEFMDKFVYFDIYNKTAKNRIYILSQLENYENKERVDLDKLLEEKVVSIEHIMPQTLSDPWKEELGQDWEAVHSKYLNTIGNISLTGYNSKLSNAVFSEKKNMKGGYENSRFFLNKTIVEHEKWTKEAIEDRATRLQVIAKEIWAFPRTEYTKEDTFFSEYTLDHEKNFTGEKATGFTFLGYKKAVGSWTELFTEVISTIYLDHDTLINELLNGKQGELRLEKLFSLNKSDLRDPVEIEDNIYVEVNLSTEDKLSVLRKLFTLAGIDYSDLSFTIASDRNTGKHSAEKSSPGKIEIRLRFWAYLLNEMNQKSDLFKNISPSKDNWITCSSGQKDVYYSFVVTATSVRVELGIDGRDKDDNKKIFDDLYAHKETIESSFGNPLEWDRLEDKKSSKIRYSLENINIFEEENWEQATTFLVENMVMMEEIVGEFLGNQGGVTLN